MRLFSAPTTSLRVILSTAGAAAADAVTAELPFTGFAEPPLKDNPPFTTESDNVLPTASSSSLSDATLTEYLRQNANQQKWSEGASARQAEPECRKRVRNHVNTAVFRESLYKNTGHARSVSTSGRNPLHSPVSKFLAGIAISNCFSDAPLTTRVRNQRLLIDSAELRPTHSSFEATCKIERHNTYKTSKRYFRRC